MLPTPLVKRPPEDFVHGSVLVPLRDVMVAGAFGIGAVAAESLDFPMMLRAEVLAHFADWHSFYSSVNNASAIACASLVRSWSSAKRNRSCALQTLRTSR
jgi:hypothetical protein